MPKQAQQRKNSLQNFAKKDPTTVGYTPWRKKNAQNEARKLIQMLALDP